jgi:hypothetical protein
MPETVLAGTASYPGVDSVLRATYTLSQGISPGTVAVTMPELPTNLAVQGDVAFLDGVNSPIVVPGCKVDRIDGDVGESGTEITLYLLDRRWKWRFPVVFGFYNQPEERTSTVPLVPVNWVPGGNQTVSPENPPQNEAPLKPGTVKTARQLAALCLQAMGETNFDVSALDPQATPTVNWDATPAAQALQSLVEDLGCRVVYSLAADKVLIAKQGFGAALPDDATPLQENPSLNAPERPDGITLYGARVQCQMRFALEAVGEDFDGSIRPIDKLSYKPKQGWPSCGAPPGFPNLPGGLPGAPANADLPGKRNYFDAQHLASKCVFRYYRITEADPGEIGRGGYQVGQLHVPPGDKKQSSLKTIDQVRLLPWRCETTRDDLRRPGRAPAVVYGVWSPPQGAGKIGLTGNGDEVRVPFTIDAERQMVCFSDYVYKFFQGLVHPAEIVLECACEFTENKTLQYVRYQRSRPLKGDQLGTKDAVIVREDVEYKLIGRYDENSVLQKVDNNEKEIAPRADFYLLGESIRYQPDTAENKTYIGLKPIYPDGAIMQVTWSVGPEGPVTQASRNTEHVTYLPSFGARRRNEETNFDVLRRERQDDYRLKEFLARRRGMGGGPGNPQVGG